jgi:hypothetical protein
MPKKAEYQRIRFSEADDVDLEPGLHAMCQACYDTYAPIVLKRTKHLI